MRLVLLMVLALALPRLAAAQACITCWDKDCHELEGVVPACAPAKKKAPLSPEAQDRAVVAKAVQRYLGAVRACYERALKHAPTLRGTVVVRFEVARDGTVSNVQATKDTFPTPDVAACVTRAARGWRIGDKLSKTPLLVAYPFVFSPGKN